ncbi:MAG TPA: hypothetical protein PLW32_04615 [Chitinophagaceae bacterium]|jgi:hypothetical protein|nr:hypothetical protein [Chitinophagaceae bacterium]HPH23142.1 hypothetical protein [Chitinophagaceae bacterium]
MNRKLIYTIVILLLIALAVFCYVRFVYVFAQGTKAGVLNTFQKKGYVFKTWEGIIIQSGFKANVQSNEFEFSVTNEKVAALLEKNSGREVNLHYVRYFGRLPWRGMSTYIVDSVYEVRDGSKETTIKPTY